MSSKESRKRLYKQSRAATGMNKASWANLFSLGAGKGAAEVDKKEKNDDQPGSRGVNMPEALASGYIEYFFSQGYDMENTSFDENGKVLFVPNLSLNDMKKTDNQLLNQDIEKLCDHCKTDTQRTDIGFGFSMLVELCKNGTPPLEAMTQVEGHYKLSSETKALMLPLINKYLK